MFSLEFLRRPEVIELKTKAGRAAEREPKPAAASVEGYSETDFTEAKSAFLKAVKRGRGGQKAVDLMAAMKKPTRARNSLRTLT